MSTSPRRHTFDTAAPGSPPDDNNDMRSETVRSRSEPLDHMRNSRHAPAMNFLRTKKTVQYVQRRDKLAAIRKAKSHRGTFYRGDEGGRSSGEFESVVVPGFVSERTPLNVDGKKTTIESGGVVMASPPQELKKIQEGVPVQEPEDEPLTATQAVLQIICGKGIISLCLLAIPFALLSVYLKWSDTWIFWLNFIVMVPLASILGDFTEEVALHTNETIGGLINASFGNAVEVVVAIQALLANEIRVVQASMLGSIFSNLLLVLGCCFFFGGIVHKEQSFNSTAATANMGLLALSSIALVLPTPFAEYYELHDEHALVVSRLAAIFLMFMYIQLLLFQLITHTHLFEGDSDDVELATISLTVACMGLLTTTLLVAIFSEYLVGSIDGFTETSGVSRTFVGLIILPVVGNAVEHISAVTVAMKDKMDLAMGIAVGSSSQISLFVVPLTVLVGWLMGRDMNLNFPHFEIILYILSICTVSIVLGNPKCNWLEGSLLVTTYIMIAVGFWFESVRDF